MPWSISDEAFFSQFIGEDDQAITIGRSIDVFSWAFYNTMGMASDTRLSDAIPINYWFEIITFEDLMFIVVRIYFIPESRSFCMPNFQLRTSPHPSSFNLVKQMSLTTLKEGATSASSICNSNEELYKY